MPIVLVNSADNLCAEQCEHRITNSQNSSHVANRTNTEQSLSFSVDEQSEHRTVQIVYLKRTVHCERTVRTPKIIKSSEQSEQSSPDFCSYNFRLISPCDMDHLGDLVTYSNEYHSYVVSPIKKNTAL